ncbi:MAG: class I SAM-dependent methyltransferase [Gaiellaceae bacterium]
MAGAATEFDTARRDALVERIFGAALGTYETLIVYLGEQLGFYRALAERGACTPRELAAATGTHERYVREWLEQQAVTGLLEVEDVETAAEERRYGLPVEYAEVLLDQESLSYVMPMARFAGSFTGALPALQEAFRTGGGVPWTTFGADGREAQAGANRPLFANLLGSEWLPALPDVHGRLEADPPARVADIACGAGWSSIGIARAYPKAHVDGFDLDENSVQMANENVAAAGLADRVRVEARDAGDPELRGSYQLVTVFEALHDMSRPVEVLGAMRGLAAEDGAVLVMDEKVADAFTAPGDEVERLMYSYSVLSCLAVGLSEQPSAGTGTVMRTGTLRRYAEEAGYSRVEVLPIEHEIFRFYRLYP